jgi:hypothetical protein
MTLKELSLLRLSRQHISDKEFDKPKKVVAWMGGMQAQDYSMARWALGVRLPGATQASIQQSIDKGDVIRTHVLRPTWHFISSGDARWLIELTAPHIKPLLNFRQKELELTSAVLSKSMKLLEKELSGGNNLTRDELVALFEKAKIATHDQRTSHILVWAELEMIICSGPLVDGKNTYAFFDDRVKSSKSLTRERALKMLASRYFTSHGPATLADFINWSALPVRDARKALDLISKDLHSETIDSQTYWFKEPNTPVAKGDPEVWLLPAFDEFIIGYKDRSACLQPKHRSAVISVNGIFWPVIVVNGQVIGLWKRVIAKGKVNVDLKYFPGGKPADKAVRLAIEDRVEQVRAFFKGE